MRIRLTFFIYFFISRRAGTRPAPAILADTSAFLLRKAVTVCKLPQNGKEAFSAPQVSASRHCERCTAADHEGKLFPFAAVDTDAVWQRLGIVLSHAVAEGGRQ